MHYAFVSRGVLPPILSRDVIRELDLVDFLVRKRDRVCLHGVDDDMPIIHLGPEAQHLQHRALFDFLLIEESAVHYPGAITNCASHKGVVHLSFNFRTNHLH